MPSRTETPVTAPSPARPRDDHDGPAQAQPQDQARAESQAHAPARPGAAARSGPSSRPQERISLLWRVFAANVVLAVAAVALLAWTPITVHRVATGRELAFLSIGLALMLAVDLVVLRRAFAPLQRLAAVMSAVTPGEPGRRAPAEPRAGREVTALADALNAMLDRLEGERRASGRRALAAQEGERKRIARELHDEIGQTLTAIALRAERAAGEAASTDQTEALTEIARTALQSLADVQRIGRELRPEALDDLGLVNALIVLCTNADDPRRLRVRCDLQRDLPPLPPDVELVIYRVAQEALTNALRHSGGSEAIVSLRQAGSHVVLSVADDGRGAGAQVREGGLRGMRERAMLIDAELTIDSVGGRGTRIVLVVPLTPANGDADAA